MRSNKDSLKIMSSSKIQRERDDKNMKICQFWSREFMPLGRRYEERVQKFAFFAQNYRIRIKGRIILDCINHSSNSPPPPPLSHFYKGGGEGWGWTKGGDCLERFFAFRWNFYKKDKNIFNAFQFVFFEFSKLVLWNI